MVVVTACVLEGMPEKESWVDDQAINLVATGDERAYRFR